VAVCVQGLLGGLRVSLFKDEIGIFHAMLAQSFFCLAMSCTAARNCALSSRPACTPW
jgi:hypothetical protein